MLCRAFVRRISNFGLIVMFQFFHLGKVKFSVLWTSFSLCFISLDKTFAGIEEANWKTFCHLSIISCQSVQANLEEVRTVLRQICFICLLRSCLLGNFGSFLNRAEYDESQTNSLKVRRTLMNLCQHYLPLCQAVEHLSSCLSEFALTLFMPTSSL